MINHRIITLAAALSLAQAAQCQTYGTAPTPTSADCTAAASTLTTGSLTARDSQFNARETASLCSGGGTSIATAMGRWKTTNDTLGALVIFSAGVADSAAVAGAISVAGDGSASQLARTAAIRLTVARLFKLPATPIRELTDSSSALHGGCVAGFGSIHDIEDTTALPSSLQSLMLQQVAPVEWNTGASTPIRSAVNCLMNEWRRANALPILPLVDMTSTSLSVEYVCSSRFRIKNSLYVPLPVRYKVGSDSPVTIVVAPRHSGQTYGISDIDIHKSSGAVSLYVDNSVVSTATATGTACF